MNDALVGAGSHNGAAVLRGLHVPGDPLVLPNAWDAASARMVEEAGFPAVATSSNATAAILGYADGEVARWTRFSPRPSRSCGRSASR
ncbi:MAG TPA: isocitrate lyase/phosphoenolpyruvate mutase family protein [Mycobacteriales bacterium]|nr:isocitrate lyase/phosphoenolpyruvate mutase family protein [Mycobacteriales bacterium]